MDYKVLLVDDEPLILEGLERCIPWHEAGFRIAGKARNGQEALAMLGKETFDLIVTDVRMPFLDGIGLIKAISERYPHAESVIVSGYGDFEYARKAIEYGATGYMLKPTRHEELAAILTKAKQRLDGRREVLSAIAQARTDSEYVDRYRLDSALRDLIFHNNAEAAGLVGELMPAAEYRLGLVKDCGGGNLAVYAEPLGELERRLPLPSGSRAALLKNETGLLLVLAEQERGDMRKPLHQLLIDAAEQGRKLALEPRLFAAASAPLADLREIYPAFEHTVRKLRFTFYATGGLIDVDPDRETGTAALFGEPQRETVNRIMLSEKPEAVTFAVREYVLRLRAIPMTDTEVAAAAHGLLNAIWVSVAEHVEGYAKTDLFPDDPFARVYDFEALEESLIQCAHKLIRLLQEHHVNYFARMVHLVYKYVEDHYRDYIKLEEVAKAVSTSVSYFCYIFKKETGHTFVEYLIGYRLERAKELLLTTELKIYEVSEQVGYTDVRHFLKHFKRTFGTNPGEFRRRGTENGSADGSETDAGSVRTDENRPKEEEAHGERTGGERGEGERAGGKR